MHSTFSNKFKKNSSTSKETERREQVDQFVVQAFIEDEQLKAEYAEENFLFRSQRSAQEYLKFYVHWVPVLGFTQRSLDIWKVETSTPWLADLAYRKGTEDERLLPSHMKTVLEHQAYMFRFLRLCVIRARFNAVMSNLQDILLHSRTSMVSKMSSIKKDVVAGLDESIRAKLSQKTKSERAAQAVATRLSSMHKSISARVVPALDQKKKQVKRMFSSMKDRLLPDKKQESLKDMFLKDDIVDKIISEGLI